MKKNLLQVSLLGLLVSSVSLGIQLSPVTVGSQTYSGPTASLTVQNLSQVMAQVSSAEGAAAVFAFAVAQSNPRLASSLTSPVVGDNAFEKFLNAVVTRYKERLSPKGLEELKAILVAVAGNIGSSGSAATAISLEVFERAVREGLTQANQGITTGELENRVQQFVGKFPECFQTGV